MRKTFVRPLWTFGFLMGFLPAGLLHAQAGQGIPVLVTTSYGGAYYLLADENGIQRSQPPVHRSTVIGLGSYGSALGDFDNDGIEDYLIGGRSSASAKACIEFHKGYEPGAFWYGVPFYPRVGWDRCSLVMDFAEADFNNDGNLDVAVNNPCTRSVQLLLGTGTGFFVEKAAWGLPFYAVGLDAGDVNADGCQDVVSVSWDSALLYARFTIEVLLGDCAGGFSPGTLLLNSPFAPGTSPVMSRAVTVGDFDADGAADLLASCKIPSSGVNDLLHFYAGLGDGTFEETPIVSGPISDLSSPPPASQILLAALDAGDFDGDGFMDVAAVHLYRPEVAIYFGLGDGTFSLAPHSLVIGGISACLTGISAGTAVPESNEPPVADSGGPYGSTTNEVFLDVDPDTFNIRSPGKWLTAYLQTDPMGEALVTLDGSGSFDPEGDGLTYKWTITDPAGEFCAAEGLAPTLQLAQGSYLVDLVVSDGKLDSEPSSTTLEVKLLDLKELRGSDLFLNGVPGSGSEFEGSVLGVRFDRAAVKATLTLGDRVVVHLAGAATGCDHLRVIDPGKPQNRR